MTTEGGNAETEVNPGVELFVWPKAYEHAAQTVVDKVFKEDALTNAYKAFTQLNDVQVTRVVKPTLRIDIRRHTMIWTIDNVSVAARGLKRHQHGEDNFEKYISGSLEFSIDVVRAGPYSEPIYTTEVNSDNMTFFSSSRGNSGFNVFNGNASSSSINYFSSNPNSGKRTYSGGVHMIDVMHMSSDGMHTRYANGDVMHMSSDGMHMRYANGDVMHMSSDGIHMRSANGDVMDIPGPSTKRRKGDELTIGGNNSMFFNNFNGGNSSMRCSGRASDDDLGKTLICAFSTALLESLNDHLPDYSFPIGSTNEWMFDFSGLARPRFRNGYLGSTHVGAFHYSDIPNTMQVQQASLFPEPQNSGRMLTMFISNYVFNTIGYGFHGLGILSHNLTEDDLISTQDNIARSIADCFPEFSVMYPGASVEVSMASTEPPTAKFSGQSLKVAMIGSAIFRAHLPNGSLENFLSTEVNLETTLLLKLNVNALTGTVTSIVPTSITVVETVLHSLNREVLKEAFDMIATQFLWRKFEELASDGIPLPSPLLSRVEAFENVVLSTADDYLRIDTNLRFDA